jgi:hypothetical protein
MTASLAKWLAGCMLADAGMMAGGACRKPRPVR